MKMLHLIFYLSFHSSLREPHVLRSARLKLTNEPVHPQVLPDLRPQAPNWRRCSPHTHALLDPCEDLRMRRAADEPSGELDEKHEPCWGTDSTCGGGELVPGAAWAPSQFV